MKKVALFIILILVIGSIYYLEQSKVSQSTPDLIKDEVDKVTETSAIGNTVKEEIKPSLKDGKYPLAPELKGIEGYINSEEGIKISDFEGKVVLIDFWTYSCINCIRTLPYLTSWDEKYKDNGLVIIGVHTPEFDFEKNKNNVENAIKEHNIEYRVVQDNSFATWKNYNNRFWPAKYLIDSDGYIRYTHFGEGKYEETELMIQELLEEAGEKVDMDTTKEEDQKSYFPTTPELYAGYEFALPRGQNVGNEGGLSSEKNKVYTLPGKIESDMIYIEGNWLSNKDNLELTGNGSIVLKYQGREVNIVADGNSEMVVLLDGKIISKVLVNEPKLYNVVKGEYGKHTLTLNVKEPFLFHAFTFG